MGTSAAVAVGDGAELPGASLSPALPNPFRDEATLRFTIDRAGPVRLDGYDVSGRHVRALVNEVRKAGLHSARWSGRDDSGRIARAGVYFVRLEFAAGVSSRRVVFTPQGGSGPDKQHAPSDSLPSREEVCGRTLLRPL
jgi:flagellar hook assembly protein FlgD